MRVGNVTDILTLNGRDFLRYGGINVFGPQDIIAGTTP